LRAPTLPLPTRGSTGFAPALRTRSNPPASVRPAVRPSTTPAAAQKPEASPTAADPKPRVSTKPASFLSTVTPPAATKLTEQVPGSPEADALESGWSEPPPKPGTQSGEG
jgi:hypothetical protein